LYCLTYRRAQSLAEARDLLAKNEDAKLLAGGMSLIPTLKQRLAAPSMLIDIGQIAELRGISMSGERLFVGAGARHVEVAKSAIVRQKIPALASLALNIGDPQVRNQGTMGGSVAHNDPVADYPAAVLALNASIQTLKREIAADDFFRGMFETALEPGEIITGFLFPIPVRAAYQKFPHPASGYAMTGVFVADLKTSIRVAVTGAGPGVFRWKEAEAALAKDFSARSIEALLVSPDGLNSDMHAPAEYRANLVSVMAARAVASIEKAGR
jgi:aerobic carbon-monoxide dehydrogenase medium subunit